MTSVVSGELARPDRGVVQAVYLVFIHIAPGEAGDSNVELVGAKLTLSSAERVQRNYPGAWIEKILADKN